MGYDLHITRKEDWADEMRPDIDISIQEWLAYINQDQELKLSDAYRIRLPGSETESQVAPGFCEWTNHPQDKMPTFDYFDGEISTKNPDEFTIQKMLAISDYLNAKVQGDDGEIYDQSSINKLFNGRIANINTENSTKTIDTKPWWKFW